MPGVKVVFLRRTMPERGTTTAAEAEQVERTTKRVAIARGAIEPAIEPEAVLRRNGEVSTRFPAPGGPVVAGGLFSLHDGLRGNPRTPGEKDHDRHNQTYFPHGYSCAGEAGSIKGNQCRIAARRASRFFFQAWAPDSISRVTIGIFFSIPAQVPNEPGVG